MDRRWGSTRVSSGDSSEVDSQRKEEEHRHHSDDESELETQGASSRRGIVIKTMEDLTNAIKSKKISEVTRIWLDGQDIARGRFGLAMALATWGMIALEELVVRGNLSEAVVLALSEGNFPHLRRIDFGKNVLEAGGIGKLGDAIVAGKLKKLERLSLRKTGIDDNGMQTLANAFKTGGASVVPHLRRLNLGNNRFTELGLHRMASALVSGCLDSLESICLKESPHLSQEGAAAIVSALERNWFLDVDVEFEWDRFPDLESKQKQLRERNSRHKGSSMVRAAFGSIYLCGNATVDKTTLCHTLQRTLQSRWTTKWRPQVTRGMDVGNDLSKISSKDVTLFVYELAISPVVSLSNAVKATAQGKATIFVIVCEFESPLDEIERQLDDWLSAIKKSNQTRDVFVVLDSMGKDKEVQRNFGPYWQELLHKKREKFSDSVKVHTDLFVLDVRRREKVKRLKTVLLECSRTLLKELKIPEICDKIVRRLPILCETKKDFPVLHWEEFLHEAENLSGKGREQMILLATEYLNEAGALIYIDFESLPFRSVILYRRLIILNPNWFWNELIGNIFLSEYRRTGRESNNFLRSKVNPTTGCISLSDFKSFFSSKWNPQDCDDLIAISLWSGLCCMFKEKVWIPSLIDRTVDAGDPWQCLNACRDGEDGAEQWVMGFSIEHKKNASTGARMELWGRFKDELRGNPKFGHDEDVKDNDFVAEKYFMSFTVDYMNVRIEVDAEMDSPTFDEISIFVKPVFSTEELDINQRKQRQVDLADTLINILVRLWKEICSNVKYVIKVVWPWPISESCNWPLFVTRPLYNPDRNLEVSEVIEWVRKHDIGHTMEWCVGSSSEITGYQLLSTNHKRSIEESGTQKFSMPMLSIILAS